MNGTYKKYLDNGSSSEAKKKKEKIDMTPSLMQSTRHSLVLPQLLSTRNVDIPSNAIDAA